MKLLIIRLRARDFYEAIVDEGEARNRNRERESNCFSRIRDHLKKMRQENDCFATRYLSRNR